MISQWCCFLPVLFVSICQLDACVGKFAPSSPLDCTARGANSHVRMSFIARLPPPTTEKYPTHRDCNTNNINRRDSTRCVTCTPPSPLPCAPPLREAACAMAAGVPPALLLSLEDFLLTWPRDKRAPASARPNATTRGGATRHNRCTARSG